MYKKRRFERDESVLGPILTRQMNYLAEKLDLPGLQCVFCGLNYEYPLKRLFCYECEAPLVFSYEDRLLKRNNVRIFTGAPGIWRYQDFLPLQKNIVKEFISLGEGNTPLLKSQKLSELLDVSNLMVKDETMNPTGSFLDRGSALLVTAIKSMDYNNVIVIGGGNFAASISAYSAKAGIKTNVFTSTSMEPEKIVQASIYGATVSLEESWYAAANKALSVLHGENRYLAVSVDPLMVEGKKTTILEILEQLSWKPPDFVVLPAADGAHMLMTLKGMLDLEAAGMLRDKKRTKLVAAYVELREETAPPDLKTMFPEYLDRVKRNMESIEAGLFVKVSGSESIRAAIELARTEGILPEPAAAAPIAAISKLREQGMIDRGDSIVAIITGTGLKDIYGITRRITSRLYEEIEAIGETKKMILLELSRKVLHGYDVWKRLRERGIRITLAAVYEHLTDLEKKGYVVKAGESLVRGRRRVYYTLSDKGYTALYS